MVGDIVIRIKTLLKQCFCIHDYKYSSRMIGGSTICFKDCKKCSRTKVE